MIIRVEMCLNSRPISQLSENATDLQILTPGHFLTGEHLQDIPEDDLKEIPDSKLKRFQLMKKRFQLFWKRWSTEYLTQLQLRTNKGSKSPMEIKLDQLVVIKEDNLPPTEWAIGRIVALHPGKDGAVRVVTLRTAKRDDVTRPVNKLAILPIL